MSSYSSCRRLLTLLAFPHTAICYKHISTIGSSIIKEENIRVRSQNNLILDEKTALAIERSMLTIDDLFSPGGDDDIVEAAIEDNAEDISNQDDDNEEAATHFADSASRDAGEPYHEYKAQNNTINDYDDTTTTNSNSTTNNSTTPWHEAVTIPYIEKDSLLHDAFLGTFVAAAITLVIVFIGLFFRYVLCPDSCNHKSWSIRRQLLVRKRYRIEESGRYKGFFSPLRKQGSSDDGDYYDDSSTGSNDSWSSDEMEDPDKLEYGETNGDFDDETDYNIAVKSKGRYEDGEIQSAATQYFSEERVQSFFNHSFSDSESDSDDSDTPLDLELIERKIMTSMKKNKVVH